jgi:cytoskeletal protein CcmA (bactofilin family)
MRKKSLQEYSINSLLGEKSNLSGEFNIRGPLRIDGNFYGKINSTGKVIIGKHGKTESVIVAKTAIIGGTVIGNVYAEEKVSVLKTGRVKGNIYSCSITMDDGVEFEGECKILSRTDISELVKIKREEPFDCTTIPHQLVKD